MDSKIKSALDAAGTAADYSARATYQRGYDAGVIDAKNTISVCGECDAVEARAKRSEALVSQLRCVADISGELGQKAEARADAAIARADAAEAREWALGVQVVAQAARLKLADELAVALRSISPMLPRSLTTSAHGDPVWTTAIRKVESALAAWDAVPGMEP